LVITNNLNLPEPIVAAIRAADESYSKGECDFSCTELVAPPRIAQLFNRNTGKLEEDASDRIFSLIGIATHYILENAKWDGYTSEERYFMDFCGVRISGKIDLYHWTTKTLFDYKITSYHAVSDGPKPEWVAQANINRLIMDFNEIAVEKAQIVAIYRDFSKMMQVRRSDYPEKQVEVVDIPLWPRKHAEEYLEYRIRVHKEARDSRILPLCTPEERWQDPDRWALMKKGQKRARKLYDTQEEAHAAAGTDPNLYLEQRIGEPKRCLFYCPVARFCDFGRELLMEKL